MTFSEDELQKRRVFPPSFTHTDYIKGDARYMHASGREIHLENLIIEDALYICLQEIPLSVSLINCEFRKGIRISRAPVDAGYSIFLYKCDVAGGLELPSFDHISKISIDSSNIDQLSIFGKNEKTDLYGATIGLLRLEGVKCHVFRSAQTRIERFSFYKTTAAEVEFDTDMLAISDYHRFVPLPGQTRKEVSEQYHLFVLKSAKSIRAKSKINYQLSKATMVWTGVFFGYFYKPLYVILWINAIIFLYSFIYWFFQETSYLQALYFSVHTFLTIGFGDIDEEVSLFKTLLIFSEGLLGIMYVATLLTSIINSTRK